MEGAACTSIGANVPKADHKLEMLPLLSVLAYGRIQTDLSRSA